jgi:hypothetical protein
MSAATVSDFFRLIVRLLLGCAQFVGVAYAALVTWLMAVWMTGTHWAAHARDIDWWVEGLKRLGAGVLTAALVGGVLLIMNRALVYWEIMTRVAPIRIAVVGASVVALAALAGAIEFIVTRPYM